MPPRSYPCPGDSQADTAPCSPLTGKDAGKQGTVGVRPPHPAALSHVARRAAARASAPGAGSGKWWPVLGSWLRA